VSERVETVPRAGSATVVTGVRLPFAAMNAAGFAVTATELRALARSHTGAVVLRTATTHPFVHPQFRALHNPGFDKLLPLVRELAGAGDRPVVASIAGATTDELVFLTKAFAEAGAAVIEVELADPWVESTLAPFDDADSLVEIARRVAGATARPCWVKLPERPARSYAAIVAALAAGGVRGIVARNDFSGMEKLLLDVPATIDVVALGGIDSGYDVARALAKGARAVQVDATLRSEGAGVFARLEREMARAVRAGAP